MCHKRMRNHNKSVKAHGLTGVGVGGFDRPTVIKSVDIFFKRYINYRNLLFIIFRRCPKMYFYKNNIIFFNFNIPEDKPL